MTRMTEWVVFAVLVLLVLGMTLNALIRPQKADQPSPRVQVQTITPSPSPAE